MRSRICSRTLAHATATPEELGDRARALGTDLDRPHLVVQAVPRPGTASRTWDEVATALETTATRSFPGSLFDRRDAALRGLIRLDAGGEKAAVAKLRELHATLNARHPLAIGLSQRCEGAASFRTGFEEAEQAVGRGGHRQSRAERRRLRRSGCLQVPAASGPGRPGARPPRKRAQGAGRVRPPPPLPICRRWRSTSSVAGTSQRRRRRCTCTPTPCGSGCAGFKISRGWTSPTKIGS